MKILIICQDYPSTHNPLSLRVLNSIKYLNIKYNHQITLVAFKRIEESSKYSSPFVIQDFCEDIETIEIPSINKTTRLKHLIKNLLWNFPYVNASFFITSIYSVEMQKRIKNLIDNNEYDLIFINDWNLLFPLIMNNHKIPRILEVHVLSNIVLDSIKHDKSLKSRLINMIKYLMVRNIENQFRNFDSCVTVSKKDKFILESVVEGLNNIQVIPLGVDIDYFSPIEIEEEFPSLIFIGNMSSENNIRTIINFYNEIFPIIKKGCKNIKLYIVGKNPSKEVLKLNSDNSVIVTGFVKDVRPYIAKASVVVVPINLGYGIKTRILESMSMNKAIVSTSRGVEAINVSDGENILIADNPQDFSDRVLELLSNEVLRKKIGNNARKLMLTEYSWEIMADKLNNVFISTYE